MPLLDSGHSAFRARLILLERRRSEHRAPLQIKKDRTRSLSIGGETPLHAQYNVVPRASFQRVDAPAANDETRLCGLLFLFGGKLNRHVKPGDLCETKE